MSEQTHEIEHLVVAIDSFVIPLRRYEGYNDTKFKTLCEAIEGCRKRWSDDNLIPKMLAWQLATLSFAIIRYAENYENGESELITTRIC